MDNDLALFLREQRHEFARTPGPRLPKTRTRGGNRGRGQIVWNRHPPDPTSGHSPPLTGTCEPQ